MKLIDTNALYEEAGESTLRTGGLYIGDYVLKKTMKSGINLPQSLKGGMTVWAVNFVGGCVIRLLQENNLMPKKLFAST